MQDFVGFVSFVDFVMDKLTTMNSSLVYAVFRFMATQLAVRENCEVKLRVSRPFSQGYWRQKKKKKGTGETCTWLSKVNTRNDSNTGAFFAADLHCWGVVSEKACESERG